MERLSLLLVLFLTSCAYYEIPTKSIKTKDYQSFGFIAPRDVFSLNLHKSIKEVSFVVLSTDDNMEQVKFFNYIKAGLLDIGFKKVISEADYANLILDKSPEASSFDLASLNRAQEHLGSFLAIQVSFRAYSPKATINMKIFAPSEPEVLVFVTKTSNKNNSVDRDFLNPLLNFVNRWYEASERGKPLKPFRRKRNPNQWEY